MTETDVNPRLGTIEITCPHCGKVNTAASEVVGAEEVLDPVAAPSDDAISLCSGCYGMSIMHNGVAVKMTIEELEKSREDPSFRRIEALSNLIRHVRKDHSDGEPEEDNETTHRLMGLSVVINTSTGEIEFPDDSADLPEGLKKAIAESVRDLHFRRMREEVQQFVTPEVANHILSVYGDDRASMPSVKISRALSTNSAGRLRSCSRAKYRTSTTPSGGAASGGDGGTPLGSACTAMSGSTSNRSSRSRAVR